MLSFGFLRHGQTQSNKETRLTGRTDVPLDQTGIEQVLATRNTVLLLNFNLVVCSPLERCRQTLDIINANELGIRIPAVLDPGVIERDFGIFEGQLRADVPYDNGGSVAEVEDVEKIDDVRLRAHQAIAKYAMNFHVLVISHGGVFNALNRVCANPLNEKPKNAVPYLFDHYGMELPYTAGKVSGTCIKADIVPNAERALRTSARQLRL